MHFVSDIAVVSDTVWNVLPFPSDGVSGRNRIYCIFLVTVMGAQCPLFPGYCGRVEYLHYCHISG